MFVEVCQSLSFPQLCNLDLQVVIAGVFQQHFSHFSAVSSDKYFEHSYTLIHQHEHTQTRTSKDNLLFVKHESLGAPKAERVIFLCKKVKGSAVCVSFGPRVKKYQHGYLGTDCVTVSSGGLASRLFCSPHEKHQVTRAQCFSEISFHLLSSRTKMTHSICHGLKFIVEKTGNDAR